MKSSPTSPPPRSTYRRTLSRPQLVLWLLVLALGAGVCGLAGTAPSVVAAEEDAATVEKRLADTVRYLASDELEGRSVGTKGIDLAADYIAGQFTRLGLKTDLFDDTPLQSFSLSPSPEVGPDSKLALVGPPGTDGHGPQTVELKLGEDFTPLVAGGAGEFDLPLVFVGYGITAQAEGYDDYAGVDVTGKAVVVLRHEPQQADPKSVFNGTKPSAYAPFRRKLSNACRHGAAAVIFCNDQFEIRRNVAASRRQWQQALDRLADESAKFKQVDNPSFQQLETQRTRIDELLRQAQSAGERLRTEYDPVLSPRAAGGGDSGCDVPIVSCRRAVLDRAVKAALATDLAMLEEQIDQGPQPHSRELTGWRVAGRADVQRKQAEVKNVVAVLEGEGPLADETIVVGAHYDHLGTRGAGSTVGRMVRSLLAMPPQKQEVYNGADDNASGVAGMIEIARTLANRPEKLHRRVVFVAFTAEERGLLGSRYYVDHPPFPLEKTVAMVNLDMLGRLREEKLIVVGSGSGTGFSELLDRVNAGHGLKLDKRPTGIGGSDHASFLARKIPALHFITGVHENLHRPTDDFETLNVPGMRRVTRFAGEVVVALANAEDRPEYVAAGRKR